jgi:ABC-type multidrug transport system fused ATPase/permease subunit
VGQWVANDLRLRMFDHLPQTGTLLSTITSDVATVQDFASSNTLNLLVDILTIIGVLGLMFSLNWDFTRDRGGGDAVLIDVCKSIQEGGEKKRPTRSAWIRPIS